MASWSAIEAEAPELTALAREFLVIEAWHEGRGVTRRERR